MKETRRYEVMQGAIAGRKTMAEASQLLGVKERQGYRIKAAIIKKGVRGARKSYAEGSGGFHFFMAITRRFSYYNS